MRPLIYTLLFLLCSTAGIRAQVSATPQCFDNQGVKCLNRIHLLYTSPSTVTGNLMTLRAGTADTLTAPFTGTVRQGRIFPVFKNSPQDLGPETQWTSRPWVIQLRAGGGSTISVPVRSKIVNSTAQYRNTAFIFKDCDGH